MNVAFDPWIPAVTTTGERKLVSLCAVFTEGEKLADLAVRPHERVSLMRLFLCVTHAALDGPKNYHEWREVLKRLPDKAQKYLTHWKDSFELFHKEKPWLQVSGLSKTSNGNTADPKTEDWTPVSKLIFSMATGNNTTLFDHGGMDEDRKIPIDAILLSMLTFQCFSPGGLISQVYWEGKLSVKSSKDGPCVPTSMIHAFLRGGHLLNTIHLNLPTYEDIGLSYGERNLGKPIWEKMPISFLDSAGIKNATETYVGRLVPITRLIRLHPSCDCMLLGDGLVYPSFSDGFPPEPSATVVIRHNKNKEERALLSFRPSKALWRELSAIVAKRGADGVGGPLSLRAIQDGNGCDLIVGALSRDKATIVDTTESVFHIPSQLSSTEGTRCYEAEAKSAEVLANRLGWALEGYRSEIDGGWEGRLKGSGPGKWDLKTKLHSTATIHYWTTVEKNLSLLMAHINAIGTDAAIPARDIWRNMLFSTACDAYRIACGRETPRQIKAFATGWQRLTATTNETVKNTSPNKEEEE